jgi:carboxyl-terminal processing protease
MSTSEGEFFSATRPTVLLVDRGTASAAEVFAAALRENNVATIVGVDRTTFGKGLVQTIAKVSDGGAIVCSTARYLTPSGRDINGVGVLADVRAVRDDDELAGTTTASEASSVCAMTPAGALECVNRHAGAGSQ